MEQESFYDELLRFIEQAKSNNLATNDYQKEKFLDLDVKVGFGTGTPAKVPWIAFLIPPNKVKNGIYPGFLYFKEQNILVLSYAVSETQESEFKWNNEDTKISISKFFQDNKYDKPYRYGKSYVYKVYDINKLPDEDTINSDLKNIIDDYKQLWKYYLSQKNSNENGEFVMSFNNENKNQLIINFLSSLEKSGLKFSVNLITRFISSLITKQFVILTGLSGSGKTKLAQAFAKWICEKNSQYRLVSVGSDWTNREPLLGYPNALNQNEYIKPESGVLDLIISANKNRNLPHFLILDEMNLSHVERYFADFLSAMESKEEITLHSNSEITKNSGVPEKITLPENLFIIGTVNIDETTYMFSPKVLDRANTIEFRVTEDEMKNFLNNISNIDLSNLEGKGASMAEDFLEMAIEKNIESVATSEIQTPLLEFFTELKKCGAEFGYRTAYEITLLIKNLERIDNTLSLYQRIDIAIMQKLLPKLHGSRRKICPVLETLAGFCLEENFKNDININNENFDVDKPEKVKYKLSLEKIIRMYKGATDNGFTSYAEA